MGSSSMSRGQGGHTNGLHRFSLSALSCSTSGAERRYWFTVKTKARARASCLPCAEYDNHTMSNHDDDNPWQAFALGFLSGLALPASLFARTERPACLPVHYVVVPAIPEGGAIAGDWQHVHADLCRVVRTYEPVEQASEVRSKKPSSRRRKSWAKT